MGKILAKPSYLPNIGDVSADFIIDAYILQWIGDNTQDLYLRNAYIGDWEADIVHLHNLKRKQVVTEYEVKISRSDFFADAKKRSRPGATKEQLKSEVLTAGDRCNYFYYLVPENLITPDEVPPYAGLIYVDIRNHPRFYDEVPCPYLHSWTEKEAPLLSERTDWGELRLTLLEKCYWKLSQRIRKDFVNTNMIPAEAIPPRLGNRQILPQ
jgi:hypothetical protein